MRLICCAVMIIVPGYGCSCAGDTTGPLCQWADTIKIAFTGTVVEAGPAEGRDPYWYRVRVNERFRGVDEQISEVRIYTGAWSCSGIYTVGREYLFATSEWRRQSRLKKQAPQLPPDIPEITGMMCSFHRGVDYAAEDIAFLRQRPETPRIYGSVHDGGMNLSLFQRMYPPLNDAVVTVSGPSGNLKTKTDIQGRFEFTNVTPGKYTVSASLGGYRAADAEVAVRSNGCGAAFFSMQSDAVISGKVVNFDGTPAAKMEVDLQIADSGLPAVPTTLAAVTKADGSFTFSGVATADVLILVRGSVKKGLHTTYWPGVVDRAKAGRLRLRANERKSGVVIRLGKPAPLRRVKVRVIRPDGRPAADAFVGSGYPDVRVNAEGFAELDLLGGASYEVHAAAGIRGTGEGRATVGPNATEVTVVLR